VIVRIADHPETHAELEGNIRRALLRRFPYGVSCIAEADEIVVLGVMHSARDPKIWPSAD